jgi:hypothetical protein
VFRLATEQLSTQRHYDFGMRSIKAMLIHAQEVRLRVISVKNNDMIELDNAKHAIEEYIALLKAPSKRRSRPDAQPKAQDSSPLPRKLGQ